MKMISSLKGLFANSESNIWLSRTVGIVLAALFIGVVNNAMFTPYLMSMWAGVLVMIAVAFF